MHAPYKFTVFYAGRGAEAATVGQIWHECECDHPAGCGHANPDGVGQDGLRGGASFVCSAALRVNLALPASAALITTWAPCCSTHCLAVLSSSYDDGSSCRDIMLNLSCLQIHLLHTCWPLVVHLTCSRHLVRFSRSTFLLVIR